MSPVESTPLRLQAPPARAGRSRLLLVANRLPHRVEMAAGAVALVPSSGGLATGLRGLDRGVAPSLWIGWSGVAGDQQPAIQRAIDARLREVDAVGVPLSAHEIAAFYDRFANGVLWPLLHDQPGHRAEPGDWAAYEAVNARFAETVAREARAGDRVWVHDYHLLLVPRMLRALRPDLQIGFFLHTPFPRTDTLAALPERAALLHGMLGADIVGFHTPAYGIRFAEALRAELGRPVACVAGAGSVQDEGRTVCFHVAPMSVDVRRFAARADTPGVRTRAAELRWAGGPLFVGVDRLDPTKGVPERLAAFERLLERQPALRGRARLHQIAVPSRESVPAYQSLRAHVARQVARINARFGTRAWEPITYVYGSVDDDELSALYRAADVMLVTSLRDGMNLVAKEFVASRTDDDGVLILSEHAGAATELRAALLVDPRDPAALASAYERALEMSAAERRVRMRRMRVRIRAYDVRQWAQECLGYLDAERPASARRWIR